MVPSPESVSYSFPDSPTTPAAPIKDESRRPSLDAVSAVPSAEHEASPQVPKGGKKPRSIVNMTQEQRERKRENGKMPVFPLMLIQSLVAVRVKSCSFPTLASEFLFFSFPGVHG